jgi:hypothetical protein
VSAWAAFRPQAIKTDRASKFFMSNPYKKATENKILNLTKVQIMTSAAGMTSG